MTSWWFGNRADGFVRLTSCEICGKSNRTSVKEKGNIPRRCDDCRKTPYSDVSCAQCGELIVGRKKRYCSTVCRYAAARIRENEPGYRLKKEGQRIVDKRGGGISKCTVCGDPVDPRELSRWGFREYGLNVHESAGSHPSAESLDGPSCKDYLKKG